MKEESTEHNIHYTLKSTQYRKATHRLTVEAAGLVGQCTLEDIVNPGGLSFVLRLVLCGYSGAVVLEASVLFFLLLLLLQDVSHRVQQVVEEFMGVLLHVVVKQVWKGDSEITMALQ